MVFSGNDSTDALNGNSGSNSNSSSNASSSSSSSSDSMEPRAHHTVRPGVIAFAVICCLLFAIIGGVSVFRQITQRKGGNGIPLALDGFIDPIVSQNMPLHVNAAYESDNDVLNALTLASLVASSRGGNGERPSSLTLRDLMMSTSSTTTATAIHGVASATSVRGSEGEKVPAASQPAPSFRGVFGLGGATISSSGTDHPSNLVNIDDIGGREGRGAAGGRAGGLCGRGQGGAINSTLLPPSIRQLPGTATTAGTATTTVITSTSTTTTAITSTSTGGAATGPTTVRDLLMDGKLSVATAPVLTPLHVRSSVRGANAAPRAAVDMDAGEQSRRKWWQKAQDKIKRSRSVKRRRTAAHAHAQAQLQQQQLQQPPVLASGGQPGGAPPAASAQSRWQIVRAAVVAKVTGNRSRTSSFSTPSPPSSRPLSRRTSAGSIMTDDGGGAFVLQRSAESVASEGGVDGAGTLRKFSGTLSVSGLEGLAALSRSRASSVLDDGAALALSRPGSSAGGGSRSRANSATSLSSSSRPTSPMPINSMPPLAADHMGHLRRAAEAAAEEEDEASRAIYKSTGRRRSSGGFSLRDLLDNPINEVAAAGRTGRADGSGCDDDTVCADDVGTADDEFDAVLYQDKSLKLSSSGENSEVQEHTEWLHTAQISREVAHARLEDAGLPECGFLLRSIAGTDRFSIAVVVEERKVLHHLIARVEGGQVFQLNGAGPGIGLTVDAAVRSVLTLDGIDVLCPIYPR